MQDYTEALQEYAEVVQEHAEGVQEYDAQGIHLVLFLHLEVAQIPAPGGAIQKYFVPCLE